MQAPSKRAPDLSSSLGGSAARGDILSATGRFRVADLQARFGAGADLSQFHGERIVIAAGQLAFAALLADLDGVARQLVVCPPDLGDDLVLWAARETRAGILFTDRPNFSETETLRVIAPGPSDRSVAPPRPAFVETEWLLFTSGTTGAPKIVAHTFESLTGAFGTARDETRVWASFYDIRRYGGLQILLRALVGASSLVLSDDHEPMSAHLKRLGRAGVTHLTGTPSHWRSALWNPDIDQISPRYVRLSGEIVDQSVLDALRARFPDAEIVHAFAATETGVAFEVRDEREGFPASYLDAASDPALKLKDDSLRMRSLRCARRYANAVDIALKDSDGFVDTNDLVEIRGDRCFFLGRRGGVINVGGLKVHPEEVESVINRHPAVAASLVRGRANPFLGAIVTAEIAIKDEYGPVTDQEAFATEIKAACRDALGPYKTPAIIRIVDRLKMSAAGKLARNG